MHRVNRIEWADIADMPALPIAIPNGEGSYNSSQITEQEKRTGIKLRKITKGSYRASDIYGLGFQKYGGTPQEALCLLYEQLTGRFPYSSSGQVK